MGAILSSRVTRGKISKPLLVAVYGVEGIGKSTFASRFPAPIFLSLESGTDQIDTSRIENFKNFADIRATLIEIRDEKHEFETLVVDSLDRLEEYIFDAVMASDPGRPKSIAKSHGGYGNGYQVALDYWHQVRTLLDEIREKRKMHIVLIAHPDVIEVQEPLTQSSFPRYEIKLDKRARPLITEYVDAVFFAGKETLARRSGDELKPVETDRRILCANWAQGYSAKNRYGITEPLDLGISFSDFAKLCDVPLKLPPVADLKAELEFLIPQIKDESVREKVAESVEAAGDDAEKLNKYLGRVKQITTEG
jgi:hypothetical protein